MYSSAITKLLTALIVFIAASDVLAHQTPVQRSLMIEAWDQQLHFAAQIKIPSRLRASLDLQAKKPEEIKRILAGRALSGLKLSLGKQSLDLSKYEAKLNLDPKPGTPIILMLHGQLKLPAQEAILQLSVHSKSESVKLRVLTGTRPPANASKGKVKKGQLVLQMNRNEKVTWTHAAIK